MGNLTYSIDGTFSEHDRVDKYGPLSLRFPKYSNTKKNSTYVLPFDESEGKHRLIYRPELEVNDLLSTDIPTRPDYTFGVNVLRGVTMELSALPFWGYMNFLEETKATFPLERELFQARLDSLIEFLDSPVPVEFYKALDDYQDLDQLDSMDVEPSSVHEDHLLDQPDVMDTEITPDCDDIQDIKKEEI